MYVKLPDWSSTSTPCNGPSTTWNVNVALSTSVAVTVPARSVSSAVVAAVSTATGASFTGVTIERHRRDVRVELAVVRGERERVAPLKSAAGMYVKLPAGSSTSVPCDGPTTTWNVRVVLSTSVAVSVPPSGVSSAVVKLASVATGASLTAVMSSVTVAGCDVEVPSLTAVVECVGAEVVVRRACR